MFALGLMGFFMPSTARLAADPSNELEELLAVSPEILFYELSCRYLEDAGVYGAPAEAVGKASTIVQAASERPQERRLIEDALERPDELLRRVATFLADYWDEAFGEEWTRIAYVVDRAAEKTAKLVHSDGLAGVMQTLAPAVETNIETGTALLRRNCRMNATITADDPLALQVSYYLWPHVWVSTDPVWPIVIAIPTTPPGLPSQIKRPENELVAALRALGDVTRLNLLRLVSESPRSTKELAQLLHMSEPGVSRHLTTLARAGLVRTRREGYYVLYEVDTEALAPLTDELLGYIAPLDERRDASA